MKAREFVMILIIVILGSILFFPENKTTEEIPARFQVFEVMKKGSGDEIVKKIFWAISKEENDFVLYETLAGYISKECKLRYFPIQLLRLAKEKAQAAGDESQVVVLERQIEIIKRRNPLLKDHDC
ncbi:hypothetical protein [Chitiniphilus shinanonensis]|uniref:hypothetical protein n=1 Tax=Chitiniphilus shinanonensis TaxID=553088 RepID=UPI00305CA24A